MRLLAPPPRRWILQLPARTVRLRLTLLYGSVFLVSGAGLLAITYLLVRHSTVERGFFIKGSHGAVKQLSTPAGISSVFPHLHVPHQLLTEAQQAQAQASHQRAADLHQLLVQSGIALAVMAVISIALGWLLAGRVLRPLRRMTATTRQISARNLHERLAIDGPRDELKNLADTIDDLLGRLETAFEAQKRFVANAAHELRTPLTVARALLDETLSDPAATLQAFKSSQERAIAISQEQERLLEALLTLATSERGLDDHEPFDLSVLADTVLLTPRPDVDRLGLQLEARIAPAPTSGDPALAERLVANLLDNAVRYNVPGGRVEVATGTNGTHAFLSVANSGPMIPAAEVKRLFEPFQRAGGDRAGHDDGHHGLGLSIVRAIATAHDAKVTARARPQGGLDIEVRFPSRTHTKTHERGTTTPPQPRLVIRSPDKRETGSLSGKEETMIHGASRPEATASERQRT